MNKINIGVLAGGWSSEREISLMSGNAAYKALDKSKYHVEMYDPKVDLKKLIENRENIHLAFVLLHGRYGEDGCIQGFLEMIKIPYVGSSVMTSAMAVNKGVTKNIYRNVGLSVAKDIILKKDDNISLNDLVNQIGEKSVVKPLSEGSSVGMSVCLNKEELSKGIIKAFEYGREIMVEQYIKGREVTCCILGNEDLEALPVIEIIPKDSYRFFDYEAKYKTGATQEICPALIEKEKEDIVKQNAKRAHRALGCSVWSRTDMIIRDEEIILLETNTVPGMTENSLFPRAARAEGMSFSGLLDRLIELSLEKD